MTKTIRDLDLSKCTIKFGMYQNKKTQFSVIDINTGEYICNATLNIQGHDTPEGYVIIKDYSENEGLYNVLYKAGIVGPVKNKIKIGYVYGLECELLIKPSDV